MAIIAQWVCPGFSSPSSCSQPTQPEILSRITDRPVELLKGLSQHCKLFVDYVTNYVTASVLHFKTQGNVLTNNKLTVKNFDSVHLCSESSRTFNLIVSAQMLEQILIKYSDSDRQSNKCPAYMGTSIDPIKASKNVSHEGN